MQPAVITGTSTSPIVTQGGYNSGTDNTFLSVFSPSQRRPFVPTVPFPSYFTSGRTAQYTYAKGYKERVTIGISGPGSILWRRMVISFKSDPLAGPNATWTQVGGTILDMASGTSTAPDYRRAISNKFTFAGGSFANNVMNLIFKGNLSQDWSDPATASLDTQFVKVHSDKSIVLNPGTGTTAGSAIYKRKFWLPLNSNMIYADDEAGSGDTPSTWAAGGRVGMGDVYVIDYMRKSLGGDTATTWQFNPEGTYYWHER